jgi:long-chain acyl-CoA synthetase
MTSSNTLLITGATGLVGEGVLRAMLEADAELRVYALIRNEGSWARLSHALGNSAGRVTPVEGDLCRRGLAIDYGIRRKLTREVTTVVHAAANTCFSTPLAEARRVNTDGTRQLLSLCRAFGGLRRFTFVSTAYVAGRRQGVVLERDNGRDAGWVNAYERSKYEAECLVRESALDWAIFRPSTIVCDSADGKVSQINAVHRALKVYNRGLAAMMPGDPCSVLDVVPADYVARAIARITVDRRASHRTLHLCAGAGAIGLGELLDVAYTLWARDPMWRRRGVERVILTDLDTYNLFAGAVKETGDARLAAILASLSHFIPQLGLPKTFDTTVADSVLGYSAPPVAAYWEAMIGHLMTDHWGGVREVAA